MIYNLVVPGPIEDVEEVRILEWHGEVGATFALDELIVEFETHKALVEVRAGQHGILRAILVAAGGWQALGQPLAVFSDSADESIDASVDGSRPMSVEFEIS